MIKTTITLAFLFLSLSFPALAQKGGNPSHSGGDPVASAKKNYQDAVHKCARADAAYDGYRAAGGKHEESKLRSLRSSRDSACHAATGAHTKWGNALHAAGKHDPTYTPTHINTKKH
jgi:hypothetical protein